MSFKPLSPTTLRTHKGKSFAGIATCFICHDGHSRFFLTKLSNNARDEKGGWEYGGGGLKFGTTLEDNVRREVKEELDADVIRLDFLGYRDVFRQIDGVATHWLAMDFAALVEPRQVRVNETDVFDDGQWFTFDSLPTPLHSQVGAALKKYRPSVEALWL